MTQLALTGAASHQLAGIAEHVVKQLTPGAFELVGHIAALAVGEISSSRAPFVVEVLAPALHEVVAQLLAQGFALGAIGHGAQAGELGIQ